MKNYYFAQLDDNNVVLQTICVSERDAPIEESGIAFCRSIFGEDTNWKQTSIDGKFRLRFAGVGMNYDEEADVFYGFMPHDGFTYELDKTKWEWVAVNKPANYVGYAPSPETAVPKLLDLLELSPENTFVDLGSGDGRTVIAAAKYGMTAAGVEANPALKVQAENSAALDNVQVEFILDDLLSVDLTGYSVVFMYLGKPLCDLLLDKVRALPKGTTVISGDYCYPSWTPTETHVVDGITFSVWKK